MGTRVMTLPQTGCTVAEHPRHLVLPHGATALVVVLAEGLHCGVAPYLNAAGFGTLEVALLDPRERATERVVAGATCAIPVLANRLAQLTDCLLQAPGTADLQLGYFGENAAAAVALWGAAGRGYAIDAIVTYNARMELAGPALPCVRAPTLLIVPTQDVALVRHNRAAAAQMHCERRLELVGTEEDQLSCVAGLASSWFATHLSGR